MRAEYARLSEAIARVASARACIAQNRGYDKERAREGFESCVNEELTPAVAHAVEMLVQELDPRDVVRLAKVVDRFVEIVR